MAKPKTPIRHNPSVPNSTVKKAEGAVRSVIAGSKPAAAKKAAAPAKKPSAKKPESAPQNAAAAQEEVPTLSGKIQAIMDEISAEGAEFHPEHNRILRHLQQAHQGAEALDVRTRPASTNEEPSTEEEPV